MLRQNLGPALLFAVLCCLRGGVALEPVAHADDIVAQVNVAPADSIGSDRVVLEAIRADLAVIRGDLDHMLVRQSM